MPWQAEAAKEAATRRAPVSAPSVSVFAKARPIRAPCGTIDRHGANRSAHPGQRCTRAVLCEAHTRGVDACPSELSLRGCSDSVRSAPPPRRRSAPVFAGGAAAQFQFAAGLCRRQVGRQPRRQARGAGPRPGCGPLWHVRLGWSFARYYATCLHVACVCAGSRRRCQGARRLRRWSTRRRTRFSSSGSPCAAQREVRVWMR